MKRVLVLLMLLSLLLAAGCAKKEETPAVTAVPEAEQTAEPTEEPAAETAAPEAETTAPEAESHPLLLQVDPEDPAPGYILVQGSNFAGLLPLPTEGEYLRSFRQILPDGTECVNTIRVTPEGFSMADADCPGQDCVGQGEVTLDNMADRVLWNMVICAPHYLTLSLLTKEEAVGMAGH